MSLQFLGVRDALLWLLLCHCSDLFGRHSLSDEFGLHKPNGILAVLVQVAVAILRRLCRVEGVVGALVDDL